MKFCHTSISDAGNNNLQGYGNLCTAVFGPLGQDLGAFRAQSFNSLGGKVIRIDPATGMGVAPGKKRKEKNREEELWTAREGMKERKKGKKR
jgi:hypothetical protein